MLTDPAAIDIDRMPRGGPDASWLDRRLQTNRLEYLDRDDVDDRVKRQVVRALERLGNLFKDHEKFARLVDEIADVADPTILELGSGHGGLSRKLLEIHPSAHVTITDIDPTSVAHIAAGDLGRHPRATVRVMDATAIGAADGYFDLVVFAQSFHHLPPSLASWVFAEGTRVADKLLIIDLPRPPSIPHLATLAAFLPLTVVHPFAHEARLVSLRAYSSSAMRALARYADPSIQLRIHKQQLWGRQIVVANRPG
jgi:SAM-dependent methyltransferase